MSPKRAHRDNGTVITPSTNEPTVKTLKHFNSLASLALNIRQYAGYKGTVMIVWHTDLDRKKSFLYVWVV